MVLLLADDFSGSKYWDRHLNMLTPPPGLQEIVSKGEKSLSKLAGLTIALPNMKALHQLVAFLRDQFFRAEWNGSGYGKSARIEGRRIQYQNRLYSSVRRLSIEHPLNAL